MIKKKSWTLETAALLLPAAVFLLAVFVYPFLYALGLSLTEKGSGVLSIANYFRFFQDSVELKTVWNTLKISIPVTVLSIVLAVPIAYHMRFGVKNEKMVSFFLRIPMTLGVVLIAEGMMTFMGRNGWVMLLLEKLGLITTRPGLIHNYWGVVISLFIQSFPMGLTILIGYVRGIHPSLESASRMLGASQTQTFWKVQFPLMMPGILIAFCLNFTSNFSVFTSALMLGQPTSTTRVMAYSAYITAYEYFNYNYSSTICIMMVLIQFLILGLVFALRNKLYKGASSVGKG